MSGGPDTAGAVLTIDLDAVAANYRILLDRLAGVPAAAVVKADAYGLGADRVAPVLERAGCTTFFVALIDEGVRLRRVLPEATIAVLGGLMAGTEPVFEDHRLIPVLNGIGEIEAWARFCREREQAGTADIHVDTGMLRLGLPPDEFEALADDRGRLDGIDVRFVISHLASADEPDHPKNGEQLAAFRRVRAMLPRGRACVANSSGIFLGPDYHFDMARPGVAIYGINPVPGAPNPMRQVVRLQGKILQVRHVDAPETVGYGATHRIARPGRIATVAVGYADGYLRSLSGKGTGYIGEMPVPLVGRVSMDLVTFDVTDVPEDRCRPGQSIDLIGPHNPADRLADEAGTIGYEILTGLGRRYHRVYRCGGISSDRTPARSRP